MTRHATITTCLIGLACLAAIAANGCAGATTPHDDWQARSASAAASRLGGSEAAPADDDGRSKQGASDASGHRWSEVPRLQLAAAQNAETSTPASAPAEGVATTRETKPAQVERGPLPTFGETVRRDFKEMPRVLWSDTKAAFGNPLNLVVLGAAGGASIALRTTNVDDHIAEHYDRHNAFSGDWPDTFATLGNPAVHFALAGVWYLAGTEFQHDKTYEVGRKMFNALAITGTTTMFLKVCAWDYSPNGEWGAWPSGHVASTMAIATVLNDAYGPLVGVPMYGLTALVGIERLDDREHYLSDVVFGAALGWVVAETVMKEHRPEIFGGEIVPYVDPVNGGAGIGWLKSLGHESKPKPATN